MTHLTSYNSDNLVIDLQSAEQIVKTNLNLIENKITDFKSDLKPQPENLYQPLAYILSLGGKRIRPLLLLLSASMFDKNQSVKACNAALAIEIFHNFSLVHDDIMDKAPLRRGMPTVHKKWDENIGILSGDVMMVKAFELLLNYEPKVSHQLFSEFTKVAVEVCEGQQLDMDFEQKKEVSVADYIEMIRLKTAVLLASSLKMGGIIADAPKDDLEHLYNFGINAGIGFQLQDDFLDAFGDADKVGKKVGGDIIANKKTFLTLKSFELANDEQKQTLTQLFENKTKAENKKVEKVLELYKSLGIDNLSEKLIEEYYQKAIDSLDKISTDKENKQPIRYILSLLSNRKF